MSTDSSVDIADFLTVEYRSSIGGLSVNCRWSIGRLSYNINQKFKLSVSNLKNGSFKIPPPDAETSIHSKRWLRGTRYALSSIEFN